MKNILSRISMLFLAILVSSMLWISPAIGGDSWTLIFYLAADNEQEAYADITIDQLLTGTAEVTNHPQILVFIDRLSTEGTEVFEVLNGAKVPLPGQGEQNSASGDVLQDFATDALNLAEHDKVAFIIKSEGLSWRGIGRDNTQGIGVPDQLMSTGDLAEALSNAQNSNNNKQVDLLVLEGSIMAFIEVVYELRDAAPFLLATQSKIQPDGIPWKMIIEDLVVAPSLDIETLGTTIIDDHLEYYSDKGNHGDPNFDTSVNFAAMTLFDLSYINDVLNTHMIWAETSWLLFDKTFNLLPHARDNSEVGGYGEITEFDFQFDIQTFMEVSLNLIIGANCLEEGELSGLKTAVENYLIDQGNLIVYERNPDDGFKLHAAKGLSIWYPPSWNKYDTRDENSLVFGSLMFYPDTEIGLDWLIDSNWVEYLFEYFDRAYAFLDGNGPDGDEPPKTGVDKDFP